jgi:penicillin-insensitive murein endopeptidase
MSLKLASCCLIALALAVTACERTPPPQVTAPATAATDEAPAAELFAAQPMPTKEYARVFGTYTSGCIGGAQQLALDAPQWQVLNPSRNRAWGHPNLIRFIQRLAAGIAADGHRGLLVGDLAQPRGGPLPSDHNSHQVGLDADIWLTPLPAQRFTSEQLESFEPPSFVDIGRLVVTPQFGDAQYDMLKRAASSGDVERIFVSPPIKRALCRRAPANDREWLRKVRPWRGHMAHMHVRIACPPDSDDCKAQDEPPEGDGCGAELQSWFDKPGWARESNGRYEPEKAIRMKSLPAACRRLLTGRG